MGTRRLTHLALYTAIALTVFVIEAQIPVPVPVPGVKWGLSNVVTLAALLFLGRRDTGLILASRIILGALVLGRPSALLFSAAGGLLAYLTMAFCIRLLPRSQIWVVSILGAMAHNTGQLFAAAIYLRSATVFAFAPTLIISAIVTGCLTGLIALRLLRYEKWLRGTDT